MLFRSLSTLSLLRSRGIEILQPSFSTLLSLFSSDSLSLYDKLMAAFARGDRTSAGLYGWLTPVGKPFLVITDSRVLSQIIVEHQPKLTKHHAFGILELFRKTDLEAGPAWKVVHRIASKFPVNDENFQIVVSKLISKFTSDFATLTSEKGSCFAMFTRDFYWEVVLIMVIGDQLSVDEMKSLQSLYRDAWSACIVALGQPGAHMFSFYAWLPFPTMLSYRRLTNALRRRIADLIKIKSSRPSWSILSVIENEMSELDQLEVAMEFLFTGASSVTTSLVWMIWQIALDNQLQGLLREETERAVASSVSKETVDVPILPEKWIKGDVIADSPILEATLRETLRMYPPIHIGAHFS